MFTLEAGRSILPRTRSIEAALNRDDPAKEQHRKDEVQGGVQSVPEPGLDEGRLAASSDDLGSKRANGKEALPARACSHYVVWCY